MGLFIGLILSIQVELPRTTGVQPEIWVYGRTAADLHRAMEQADCRAYSYLEEAPGHEILSIRPPFDPDAGIWPVSAVEVNELNKLKWNTELPEQVFKTDISRCLPSHILGVVNSFPRPDKWFDCGKTAVHYLGLIDHPTSDQEVTENMLAYYMEPVERPMLGDLMILRSDEGVAVHIAIVISEGWVYTKNGMNWVSPVRFQRTQEMLDLYREMGTQVSYMRLRTD